MQGIWGAPGALVGREAPSYHARAYGGEYGALDCPAPANAYPPR